MTTLRNIQGCRRASAALVLGAAALLVCACKVDRTGYDPDTPLTFDPSLVSAPFGVDVWEYPEGGDIRESTVFLRDAVVVQDGDVWVPERAVLWPSRDRRLCLLAHAPYGSASSVTLDRGVEFKGVDAKTLTEELLYSDFVEGASKGNGGVIPVSFREALCHVDFRMRTDAFPSEKVEVKSVSILSVCSAGDFRSLPEPGWTVIGEPAEKEIFSGEFLAVGEPAPICESRRMIPQRLETAFRAEIDYTDTNGILTHWDVTSGTVVKTLLPGRHYTFTLSFIVDTCTLKAE